MEQSRELRSCWLGPSRYSHGYRGLIPNAGHKPRAVGRLRLQGRGGRNGVSCCRLCCGCGGGRFWVCVCVCVFMSVCMTEGDGWMKCVLELLSGLKK